MTLHQNLAHPIQHSVAPHQVNAFKSSSKCTFSVKKARMLHCLEFEPAMGNINELITELT